MARRVVITGLGVVTALGRTLDSYWQGLVEGRNGIGPISLIDTTTFKVHFGGQVNDWDAEAIFGKKEARHIDRFAQFALHAAEGAVQSSGIDFSRLEAPRCGVLIGSGIGGLSEFEEQYRNFMEKGPTRISPFTIPKLMVNAGSGQVSIKYGLKGPCSAIATACASAANAIGDATRLIQQGYADVMIAGGSEAAITHMGVGGFASLRALSTRNEDPAHASRPFDKDRDGFVIAEGAGLVVLEEESVAKARGAKILADLSGYGMSADGSHITAPDEEGRGAARAMVEALRDAKLNVDQIGYINAHGTSTPLGDLAETTAVKSVFGQQAYKTPVSSIKSHLGHLLGASGGVELVACVLALQNGVLPPTINFVEASEGCDLDYVPNTAREAKVDHIMSNSFGFGGHNASLIISRPK